MNMFLTPLPLVHALHVVRDSGASFKLPCIIDHYDSISIMKGIEILRQFKFLISFLTTTFHRKYRFFLAEELMWQMLFV